MVHIAEHLALSLGAAQPLAVAGWDPHEGDSLKVAYETVELSPAQLKVVEAEARRVLAELETSP